MLAQVTISETGDVTAIVDTESTDDDEASRLAGLALDDMLARAAETAIRTWFAIRTDEEDGDGCAAE